MKFYILFIFLYTGLAHAIIPFEDAVSPELVTSARALAMGNSYMSKVDDSGAAFYNPAGLGTVRGLQFHLTNLHLETNNGFLDVTNDGAFTDAVGNYSKAFKPADLRTLHAENPGHLSHSRFQVFPNLTYRGISVGYMYVQKNRARLKDLTSEFEIAERTDYGPVLALSASLFGGIIKFGASGVYLTRKELQKDFASNEALSIDADVDYKKGSMTHVTGGVRITLPFTWLPTFSGVIRNSSNTDWYDEELGGTPEKIPQTVEYGFSLTPNLGRTFRLQFEVSYKDAGDRYDDVPASRKIMGGLEFDYLRRMFVRLGFGDGWGSGGLGVRNESIAFDLTTYAIEGSDDGYREEEDRRYVLSVSGGF